MSVPTKEQLKARSKHLDKLLQEKYNLKVSHGHCLDVVAQLFGYKDWNTVSAVIPDGEPLDSEAGVKRTPWLKALNKGYRLAIEQPYLSETFYVGGVTAQHSAEKGVRSLSFTPRIDEQNSLVVLALPLETTESASDAVIAMHKQLYRQKDKDFAEKLGGRAEDIGKR